MSETLPDPCDSLAELAKHLPGHGRHFVYHLCAAVPDAPEEVTFVYVGVTSNLRQRMASHARKWWASALDIDLCAFDEHPTRALANRAEAVEIATLRPEMNRAGRLALVVPL